MFEVYISFTVDWVFVYNSLLENVRIFWNWLNNTADSQLPWEMLLYQQFPNLYQHLFDDKSILAQVLP